MSKIVISVLASICVMASACADKPSQGAKLLFQTVTLLPGKTETIILSEPPNTGSGRVDVVVTVDREVSLTAGKSGAAERQLVFDGKQAARFEASVRTSTGRTLRHEFVDLLHSTPPSTSSTRVVFHFDMSLEENEQVEQVTFGCNRKVTLFEVVWLPEALSR